MKLPTPGNDNRLFMALKGFLIGLGMLLLFWGFELYRSGLDLTDLTWPLEIHQQTPLLFILAFLPFIFAFHFFRHGGRGKDSKVSTPKQDKALPTPGKEEADREREWANTILDNAADCFITFEEGGGIIRFNKAAESLFQYRTDEVLKRQVTTLLPELTQRTTITSEDWSHLLEDEEEGGDNKGKVYETGREMKALLKDGTMLPCEVDLSRFIHGDRVTYTAIVRDITERKRNERLERLLLQVTESVNQSQDLATLYRSIHETLYQLVDASNFFIALTSADGRKHKVVYTIDVVQSSREIPGTLAQGIISIVAEKKTPLLVTPEMQQDMSSRFGDWGTKLESWLGVPLIKENQLIGVIAVYSYLEGAPYTEKDVNILAFLSTQIANALEREHNRELLRRNERRYRRIVEEAGETVYTCDLDLKLTYVNPPITRLTGYGEKELLNKQLLFLVPEEWKERVLEGFRKQLEGRLREQSTQFPIITKSGETHWIEQTTTLQEENGQAVGIQGIVHDITERRAAERALREREERFRSLSASSPIGIFQVDTQDHCNYVNARFLEITGRESEELVGSGWFNVIHPEDRETFRMEWIFAREDPGTHAREVRVQRKNREIRWVNIRWTAITDENRKITGYVGNFEDITRRKHTEKINTSLYKISQAAQNSTELTEFYAELHQCLAPIVDTTNFYIARYHHDRGTITFPYACENRVENLDLPEREVGRGLTGYVIRHGKSLLARESDLKRLYESGEVELLGKQAKVWLGVPLISKQGVNGVVVLQSYTEEDRFGDVDLQTMEFVSSQIATAIDRKQAEEENRRYLAELAEAHRRIKEDLGIAARIQQSRLPNEAPPFKGVEFSWLFNSCDEVAGDMFNFIPLDDHRVGIYILDVSGHGVPAALLSMTLSRSMTASSDGSGALLRLNGNGMRIATPSEVAMTMNERYPMNLEINQYFTFIYGILDVREKTFTFVRAGHPAPILVNREGARELEGELGPAVGILPEVKYEESTIKLNPGDRILMFTDGIEEASGPDGEEFGVERTLEILSAPHDDTVEADVKVVIEGVRKHIKETGQRDDITIVGFKLLEQDQG